MLGSGNPFFSYNNFDENKRGEAFKKFVEKHDAEFKRLLDEAKKLSDAKKKSWLFRDIYNVGLNDLQELQKVSSKRLKVSALTELGQRNRANFSYACLLMANCTLNSLRELAKQHPYLGKAFSLDEDSTKGTELQEFKRMKF